MNSNVVSAAIALAGNEYFRNAFGRLTRNVAFAPLIKNVKVSFAKNGGVFTKVTFDDGSTVVVQKCDSDVHDVEKAILFALAKRVYGKVVTTKRPDGTVKVEIEAPRVGHKIGALADATGCRVQPPVKKPAKIVKIKVQDDGSEPDGLDDGGTVSGRPLPDSCASCDGKSRCKYVRGGKGKARGKAISPEGLKLRKRLGLPTDVPFAKWTNEQKRLYWRSVKK